MLDEVQALWGVSDYAIRKAILDGRLRRVRRAGYQPYYPVSSIEACFGPRPNAPVGRPFRKSNLGDRTKGGYPSQPELPLEVAA